MPRARWMSTLAGRQADSDQAQAASLGGTGTVCTPCPATTRAVAPPGAGGSPHSRAPSHKGLAVWRNSDRAALRTFHSGTDFPSRAERFLVCVLDLFRRGAVASPYERRPHSRTGPIRPDRSSSEEIAEVLSYALRYDERGKPRRGGGELTAGIAAERLADHLRRSGFVVMRTRPSRPHSAG